MFRFMFSPRYVKISVFSEQILKVYLNFWMKCKQKISCTSLNNIVCKAGNYTSKWLLCYQVLIVVVIFDLQYKWFVLIIFLLLSNINMLIFWKPINTFFKTITYLFLSLLKRQWYTVPDLFSLEESCLYVEKIWFPFVWCYKW